MGLVRACNARNVIDCVGFNAIRVCATPSGRPVVERVQRVRCTFSLVAPREGAVPLGVGVGVVVVVEDGWGGCWGGWVGPGTTENKSVKEAARRTRAGRHSLARKEWPAQGGRMWWWTMHVEGGPSRTLNLSVEGPRLSDSSRRRPQSSGGEGGGNGVRSGGGTLLLRALRPGHPPSSRVRRRRGRSGWWCVWGGRRGG